jgi:C-terminal processing protease CtpA/Prc
MRLAGFGNHFRGFYRHSFQRLNQYNVQNLVIDLRENGGGNMGVSTVLARYLAAQPFKNADTVAAISRRFQYGKYIRPSVLYWIAMHTMSRKQNDGRYHLRYYEKHHFKPKKKNHFDGQIYFLHGGYTFSASCMVLNTLKGQPNVTLIGEETGGGSYGNTAVHLPGITLPHSRLRIVLPMYRVVFNNRLPKNGRGIVPDIEVKSTSVSIKQGVDIKFDSTMQIIKQKPALVNK